MANEWKVCDHVLFSQRPIMHLVNVFIIRFQQMSSKPSYTFAQQYTIVPNWSSMSSCASVFAIVSGHLLTRAVASIYGPWSPWTPFDFTARAQQASNTTTKLLKRRPYQGEQTSGSSKRVKPSGQMKYWCYNCGRGYAATKSVGNHWKNEHLATLGQFNKFKVIKSASQPQDLPR